jgi:hypothetical protein
LVTGPDNSWLAGTSPVAQLVGRDGLIVIVVIIFATMSQ